MNRNTGLTARWLSSLALACMTAQAGAAPPQTAAPAASAALAASAGTAYQRERAACAQDNTPQGRSTCLKEAGAAQAEAKRQQLGNGEDAQTRTQNAELRCKTVATADREHCLRMARGEGTVSGTVDGGGVLKTLVTPVPAPAPAASR